MATFAPWTHSKSGDMKDPVNLVSREHASQAIGQALRGLGGGLFRAWKTATPASTQWLHCGDAELSQTIQFARFFPSLLVGGLSRVHVRLWDLPDADDLFCLAGPVHFVLVGSAHLENALTHQPSSFEVGEKFVARELKKANISIFFDDVPLGNLSLEPGNNSFATRLGQ